MKVKPSKMQNISIIMAGQKMIQYHPMKTMKTLKIMDIWAFMSWSHM